MLIVQDIKVKNILRANRIKKRKELYKAHGFFSIFFKELGVTVYLPRGSNQFWLICQKVTTVPAMVILYNCW